MISEAFNHVLTHWQSRGVHKHTRFADYNNFFDTKYTHCRMVSGFSSTSFESPACDPMILTKKKKKLEVFKLVSCDKIHHECSEN